MTTQRAWSTGFSRDYVFEIKMIKGREMLDWMTNRFRAFERLLSDFPEFLERVMLLQVIGR